MRRRLWIAAAMSLATAAFVFLVVRDKPKSGSEARVADPSGRVDGRSGGLATPPKPLAADSSSKSNANDRAGPSSDGASVRVHGVVTSGAGVPAPGAVVEVAAWRGRTKVETASTTADSDGAYRVDLPLVSALDLDSRATCGINVTARIAGREFGRAALFPEAKRDGDFRINVELGSAMNQSIVGRVLGVEGGPAAECGVHACAGGRSVAYAQTDSDGRFVLSIPAPGPTVVEAILQAEGLARSDSVEVAAGVERDVGELRLRPASVIEGRVELPDGSISPPVSINVTTADATEKAAGACDPRGWATFTQVQSTLDGRFAFRALHPGRYRLRPSGDAPRPSGDVKAGIGDLANVFETDAHGVVLVVHQRFVVVHVVDAAGRPFEGASCSYEEARDDVEAGATGAGDFSVAGAVHVFKFARPVNLRLAFESGTMEADVLRVDMPADRWLVEATAILRSKVAHGTIRLDLVDREGKPVAKFRAEARMLVDGRRSRILGLEVWKSGDGPVSKPVRPGHYVLEIAPGLVDEVPADPGGPCFGLQRTEVTVAPSGEVVARVVAQAGGWLRATVIAPEGKSEIGCGHSIRRDGREAEGPITAMWSDPKRKGFWSGLRSGGPQFLAQPLEPGGYVLTASAEGLADALVPFTIRAGETADVEVRFVPTEKPAPK